MSSAGERISIVTDEISTDLRECEAFLARHDLHAVELRCIGDARVPTLSASDRDRLRGWARAGEPYVVAVSPGLFKCAAEDAAETERHLEELLPASLDLALELGAENLIAFTFEGETEGTFPPRCLDALREAAERCAIAGVPLLLENEPGFLASTAARAMALIEAADHAGLFVNWDPCNSNEHSIDELGRAVDLTAPRLRNVHVKNGVLAPGERFARCGPLAEGAIHWEVHLKQLQALGYDGFFCIETHFQPTREGSERVLAELRALLDRVGYTWEAAE